MLPVAVIFTVLESRLVIIFEESVVTAVQTLAFFTASTIVVTEELLFVASTNGALVTGALMSALVVFWVTVSFTVTQFGTGLFVFATESHALAIATVGIADTVVDAVELWVKATIIYTVTLVLAFLIITTRSSAVVVLTLHAKANWVVVILSIAQTGR